MRVTQFCSLAFALFFNPAERAAALLLDSNLQLYPNVLHLEQPFNPVIPAYWTQAPHHRRTPFAVSPDNQTAYLAYLDVSGKGVHVQQIDPRNFSNIGNASTIANGAEAGGLIAHNDGFALLTRETMPKNVTNAPNTTVATLYRFTRGKQTWMTWLGGPGVHTDQGLASSPELNGDLVFSEKAGYYGAYFVAKSYSGPREGQFADNIAYVDTSGKLSPQINGASAWGCSHNIGIGFEAADSPPYVSICADDHTGIWLNTKTRGASGQKISNEGVAAYAANDAMGGTGGSFSVLARMLGSDRYVFTWVSRGALNLKADPSSKNGGTRAMNRTANRNVALAVLSDKFTINGTSATSQIGAHDADAQVNWITEGTEKDMSWAHVAAFDKEWALLSWEEIAKPKCNYAAMGCTGTFTGTYFQLINVGGNLPATALADAPALFGNSTFVNGTLASTYINGTSTAMAKKVRPFVKVGSPIKRMDATVQGDMVTMGDGRVCWPTVDMKWSLDETGPVDVLGRPLNGNAAAPKSVQNMGFACVGGNGGLGVAGPAVFDSGPGRGLASSGSESSGSEASSSSESSRGNSNGSFSEGSDESGANGGSTTGSSTESSNTGGSSSGSSSTGDLKAGTASTSSGNENSSSGSTRSGTSTGSSNNEQSSSGSTSESSNAGQSSGGSMIESSNIGQSSIGSNSGSTSSSSSDSSNGYENGDENSWENSWGSSWSGGPGSQPSPSSRGSSSGSGSSWENSWTSSWGSSKGSSTPAPDAPNGSPAVVPGSERGSSLAENMVSTLGGSRDGGAQQASPEAGQSGSALPLSSDNSTPPFSKGGQQAPPEGSSSQAQPGLFNSGPPNSDQPGTPKASSGAIQPGTLVSPASGTRPGASSPDSIPPNVALQNAGQRLSGGDCVAMQPGTLVSPASGSRPQVSSTNGNLPPSVGKPELGLTGGSQPPSSGDQPYPFNSLSDIKPPDGLLPQGFPAPGPGNTSGDTVVSPASDNRQGGNQSGGRGGIGGPDLASPQSSGREGNPAGVLNGALSPNAAQNDLPQNIHPQVTPPANAAQDSSASNANGYSGGLSSSWSWSSSQNFGDSTTALPPGSSGGSRGTSWETSWGSSSGTNKGSSTSSEKGSQSTSQHGEQSDSSQGSQSGSSSETQSGSQSGSQQNNQQGSRSGSRSGSSQDDQQSDRQSTRSGSQQGSQQESQFGSHQGSESGSQSGSSQGNQQGSQSSSQQGNAQGGNQDENNGSSNGSSRGGSGGGSWTGGSSWNDTRGAESGNEQGYDGGSSSGSVEGSSTNSTDGYSNYQGAGNSTGGILGTYPSSQSGTSAGPANSTALYTAAPSPPAPTPKVNVYKPSPELTANDGRAEKRDHSVELRQPERRGREVNVPRDTKPSRLGRRRMLRKQVAEPLERALGLKYHRSERNARMKVRRG